MFHDDARTPLPPGHVIRMANGAVYTIDRLIGSGGFSLIYSVTTEGGTTPMAVKEFFPRTGAARGSDGVVRPTTDEARFERLRSAFETEGKIGGAVSRNCFQILAAQSMGNGYAIMKLHSADMHSLADLRQMWDRTPPTPFTGDPADRDPVFTDMVRVRYALRVTLSILSALDAMHEMGYLHLDISRHNVLWAGRDLDTGEQCEAFLADFGCSAAMKDGVYHPTAPPSCSPGFAAPEVEKHLGTLTPASDLYSVGMLLFYLCVGDSAFEWSCKRERHIERETAHLAIPPRILRSLRRILTLATSETMSLRYASVKQMLTDVRALKDLIPQRPHNRDNSKEFTLCSLKSMLMGSEDSRYSWADELCDRRGVELPAFPASIYDGLSTMQFQDDEHFLRCVLSKELYSVLQELLDHHPDRTAALNGILCGNWPKAWKQTFGQALENYGTRPLLKASRALLDNEIAFFAHTDVLFQLADDPRLRNTYDNCGSTTRTSPYTGLAIFTLYALLGPDGFEYAVPSPSLARTLFFSL